MNESRWQYSLRTLFIVTTFVALVVFLVTNSPAAAVLCLLCAFPFLFAAFMVFLINHAISFARLILAVIGTTFLIAGAYSFVDAAHRQRSIDGEGWIPLILLGSSGLFFFLLALTVQRTRGKENDDFNERSA